MWSISWCCLLCSWILHFVHYHKCCFMLYLWCKIHSFIPLGDLMHFAWKLLRSNIHFLSFCRLRIDMCMGIFEWKATKLTFRSNLCHWLLFRSKTMCISIHFHKGLSVAILCWMCSFYSVPLSHQSFYCILFRSVRKSLPERKPW